jgi:tetratricopeptide (TPR) repeat protein
MSKTPPLLLVALLGTVCFTLATSLELRVSKWTDPTRAGGAFTKLLGDGRKLFANQFIEMADVSLHSGYYPSIFDRRDAKTPKAISGSEQNEQDHAGHQHDESGKCIHDGDDEHEKAMDFLGEPRNWLDAFIRRFRITKHTHLENGQEREVLPWLRIAIELDPQKIETYTATAYWLREKLERVNDAEQVLREGIRNNPENPELLLEMGLLQKEGHNDSARARNLWTLALRRWEAQSEQTRENSKDTLGRIAINLANLEESAGNLRQSLPYFELAAQVSPKPEPLQKHIGEIKARLGTATPNPLAPAP